MEEFVTRSLLFDFYGELLTEHQKKVYQAVVFEDYTVSEVARDEGISRQGVHDMMKRCDRMLEEYEEKLHLVERFLMIRKRIGEIRALTEKEIESYIRTGEPMDKAGAYGIQGGAALFAEKLRGDYFNVVGLPVCRLGKLLKEIAPELMD